MYKKIPIIAVVGPTATGKTALGIAIAKRFCGEIISCDSMQIYRGLPIGTAQPTAEETAEVPHHLVSFIDVDELFSVSDYVAIAEEKVAEISSRKKQPVLVGGTGLYARSLLRGFTFNETARDDDLRQILTEKAISEGVTVLYDELKRIDPTAAEGIHPNNVKRVIRALEYCKLTGEPFSAQSDRSHSIESPYCSLMLCLSFRDRTKLYERINFRVDKMLETGLLAEAEAFYKKCRTLAVQPTAAQAIGYKELFPYFEGRTSLNDAIESVKRESRRYAKRQLTWFNREPDAKHLYVDDYTSFEELIDEAVRLIEDFIAKGECR